MDTFKTLAFGDKVCPVGRPTYDATSFNLKFKTSVILIVHSATMLIFHHFVPMQKCQHGTFTTWDPWAAYVAAARVEALKTQFYVGHFFKKLVILLVYFVWLCNQNFAEKILW